MRRLTQFLIIIVSTALLSCATTKSTSILYSDNYNKTTDQTSVMIFPYGEIKVPGKWTKTRENAVSGQYFFIGQDSARIAIALQPWDKYEFSHNNPEVTTDNFVRKFYEWDAHYLKGSYFPQPVREVAIAKKSGGVRKLGIPTLLSSGLTI